MLQKTEQVEDLVRAAQAGGRPEFARLIEAHYDQIYRFAYRYLGNRENAEDVTQLACIKLARTIGQFRFESAFSSWLYRLVINCARDFLKSRKTEPGVPVEDEPAAADDSALSSLALREVLAEIEAMGEGFREAVVLVLGQGLTHGEAASILGVSESTVSWRLHRVRRNLAEAGAGRPEDGGSAT